MNNLLYLIAAVLIIAWALGYHHNYQASGFIHLLLVIAVIVVLLRFILGRKLL
jgi:hypothetical protein